MEQWIKRGAAFGVGLWLVYQLASHPGRSLTIVAVTVVVVGIAMLLNRDSQTEN